MLWLSNYDGVIEMEIRKLIEPVPKYYFQVPWQNKIAPAEVNRNVRDWLGENCGCAWETKFDDDENNSCVVGVYFDMDTAEEDMMAFKLAWL